VYQALFNGNMLNAEHSGLYLTWFELVSFRICHTRPLNAKSKSYMACTKLFSFAEIVQGRDSSVRVTDDGLLYAVDLVMVVTGHNWDDAGKSLRRLSNQIFQSDKLSDRQISSNVCRRSPRI